MRSRNVIIFDVDGTLIDGHPADSAAYDDAFREATGRALTAQIWETFTEVTAVAIIRQALGNEWPDLASIEVLVRDGFLARLRAAHQENVNSFKPFAGARDVFAALCRHDEFKVAIATGCWFETASFKLEVTGFSLATNAFASASDRDRRADIIRLAAERAGGAIENAIYIGDGEWDLRATRELGIPFIAVGRRVADLRRAGAQHVLEEFNMAALLSLLDTIERTEAASLEFCKNF